MLVYVKMVEVSGAAHSTGEHGASSFTNHQNETRCIKNIRYLFMIKGDEQYIFGDCAINPELDSQGLAEIAVESAKSALSFGMDQKLQC